MTGAEQLAIGIACAGLVGAAGTIINTRVQAAKLEQQAAGAQQKQQERHEETKDMLMEIRTDVKRINGTVARHDSDIRHSLDEILRLREKLP